MKQMPSILLINPRSAFLDSDRVFPPLGILYLKSFLEKEGIYVKLEDDFDFKNINKYKEFHYIGISCTTPQSREAEIIFREIKKNFSLKKVIIGGAHASFYTEECIKAGYDHIVLGDGEKSLLDILNGCNEKILKNPIDSSKMNSLPLPFRDAGFLSNYHYKLDSLKTTTAITSRGCPFNCAFCEHAKTKPRYYNSERIKQELSEISALGYEAVMFFDDLFAVNQRRVEELCDIIKDFKIKFRCFGHVKCMTPKMAETLAEAGCVETGVGMESGSQEILNIVKLPTSTVKESYEYIKICHQFGIRVKAFFMIGLPGETCETIKETEEFIATSGIDDFDLVVYYPYKGTRIRDHIKEYDISLINDADTIGYYKGRKGGTEISIRTSFLSGEEIKNESDRIFKKYKK